MEGKYEVLVENFPFIRLDKFLVLIILLDNACLLVGRIEIERVNA